MAAADSLKACTRCPEYQYPCLEYQYPYHESQFPSSDPRPVPVAGSVKASLSWTFSYSNAIKTRPDKVPHAARYPAHVCTEGTEARALSSGFVAQMTYSASYSSGCASASQSFSNNP